MIGVILLIIFLAILLVSMYAILVGVPPVPTPRPVVKRMVELAMLKPGEKVYDLGCGDGRIVARAAQVGADAIGLEISPLVWLWAKIRQVILKTDGRILYRDLLTYRLNQANVVFLYLYPSTIKLFLERKFKRELRPGTRIVSYAFPLEKLRLVHREKPYPKSAFIYVYQV